VSLSLAGRRALLTGATGGLGRAIGEALVARGATVVATGRRAEALDELRSQLGEHVEVLVADLAVPDDVAALGERAAPVDVLVANAAVAASGRLDSFSPEEIDRALDVNLRAPMQLARALLPAMVERGAGHLIFVSSLNGKIPTAGASVYAATKYGMRGFAASLRDELHGSGVGATAIFPGFVAEAGMWAEARVELPPWVGLPSPGDVAEAVVKGIERGRGEIDVAPIPLRISAGLAGVAPGLVTAVGRRLGAREVADQVAAAQRAKR
jgi:uncharacterized protein